MSFRCFFLRVHLSFLPSLNELIGFFFVGGRLIWDDALDWMFFSCFVLGIMRNMVFFHVLLCICGSFHGILVWFWLVRYQKTQVHLVSYRWTWCSPTLLSTCHGHHTTQLHSAFLPNVTWMASPLVTLTLRDPTKIGWKMDPNFEDVPFWER